MSSLVELPHPKKGVVIAIDGPAGTGKSSTTKRLATELGFIHIDTGAMYRCVAHCVLEKKILDPEKLQELKKYELDDHTQKDIVEIARSLHIEFHFNPKRTPSNRVYANGLDITDEVRTPEVSLAASKVSAIAGVRAALLGLQRRLGCGGKAILEGRDIGTVIFPDADVKFFLTASVEERAKRRLAELEVLGEDAPSFEVVKKQIKERDELDETRSNAPLKKALDAIEMNTTNLSLDEVVLKIKKIIQEKIS